jgi:beta-glucanase (GH16 family)
MDVMESVSPNPSQAIGTLHGPVKVNPNYQQFQGHVSTPGPIGGSYQTWGLIWSPNQITWTLDGLPYATATPSSLLPTSQWSFNTPMRIIFDLAVGGWWGGTPNSISEFPQSLRVKWVHVYQ